MSRLDVRAGQKFGMLTFHYRCSPNKFGHPRGLFSCDCGGRKSIKELSAVVNRYTCSCGCLHLAKIAKGNPKHGQYGTREYHSWSAMIQRCCNPKNPAYRNYGARGIAVCQRWMAFKNFLSDMGTRGEGLSIDRIDNNGNYEPSNCRWATRAVQNSNTRRSRK